MIFPDALKRGDKIAFFSPASVVKDNYVFTAIERVAARGYHPVLMPHALGPHEGSFAASKPNRLCDFVDALQDKSIKAIMATRGGYGCCQLLANIPFSLVRSNPKWLIGFSDISALIALWIKSDVAAIHGPMCKHLATMPEDDFATESLFNILETGGRFNYFTKPHPYNIYGSSSAILIGGNMAVLNELADTPCDILRDCCDKDIILFFEDIAEPIYKVNRMLWRLLLAGILDNVKGLIFGQFTEYHPDANFTSMEEMIHSFIQKNLPFTPFPVAFDFPVGHIDSNFPLTVGARVEFEVSESGVSLKTV
ncbi:MAG: LD-carboxypeptidase [Muribaculaceae bacterium]|nr:LD-carboxypeptidase [Muribaculaceae bacterium]